MKGEVEIVRTFEQIDADIKNAIVRVGRDSYDVGLGLLEMKTSRAYPGTFEDYVERELPFSWRYAKRIMKWTYEVPKGPTGPLLTERAYRALLDGKSLRTKERERAAKAADVEALAPGPAVVPGEWWQLGRHHLYCGDTSSGIFVDSCPAASLAFADPPYGAKAAKWDDALVWSHDWLSDKATVTAATPGIVSIFDFARRTSMPYRWSVACWIDNGMTRGALGFGNWIYVALFSPSSLHRNAQDFLRLSIKSSESKDTTHKGRKPGGLLAWLLDTFSDEDDVVIDPFAGSGTTLLVAEKMGRNCFTGEIEPEFCSEIIARWQTLTGEVASRV